MDNFYVYRHIRLDTNTPFYVGKGKNKRAYAVKKRNNRWQSIVNKHGYRVEFLIININEDLAFKKEMEFIKLYKNFKYCEANFTDGGDGLRNPSQEIRDKIANSVRGLKHSEETKRNMSKTRLGHPGYTKGFKMTKESSIKKSIFMKNSKTNCKSIKCLNDGKTFKSLTEACITYNLSGTSNLAKVLKGTRNHINGLRFQYV